MSRINQVYHGKHYKPRPDRTVATGVCVSSGFFTGYKSHSLNRIVMVVAVVVANSPQGCKLQPPS
jgi:hypothetical protein